MTTSAIAQAPRLEILLRKDLDTIPQLQKLSADQRIDMRAVSAVLPFRVNRYVVDELIDWDRIPDDPIYQLTFPQPGMLADADLAHMRDLVVRNVPKAELEAAARQIQLGMNPHPAGQMELNVPHLDDGTPLQGMQHKYRETTLFFPGSGQTCHTYCTYCFRWAQFVGIDELKFANNQATGLADYLRNHKEVNSVLFTGGDPMVMKTSVLRRYIEPLLAPDLDHVNSIRIGTKAPAYWPFRFTSDADADDLLRLFEEVRASGRHLAVMAHYSHPHELEPDAAQLAVRRMTSAGAVVRCQAPLIRHVNDSADAWRRLWRRQVLLGAVPYYMFVERDTGPKGYFEVPLARAFEIFTDAYRSVSGLARTVRGPSMSATPGKVLVDGITDVRGEKVFVLKMLQGRDPEWVNQIFFAKYDPKATWLDDLQPAFGESEFFFDTTIAKMKQEHLLPEWGTETHIKKSVTDSGFVDWE
ncbi:MAG: lysine 2,3-aminomutase [Acidobacteria bacterium]|jgi:KamA family protein|nr:lysine 2,3-aminomutase [Acidobacteriota bacterium]